MRALVEPTIERWFPEHFRQAAPATMDRMRAMILRTPIEGYTGCCAAIRDMDQLGRDAIGVMDALGIKTAHWCGLSLGGMVGMWMLTHAPERIDKAVLANTAAYMGPVELWNGRIETARRGGMRALVEPTIERWFPEHFRQAAPATMDRMRAMILRTPIEGYTGCCAAIRDMDQRTAIRSITNSVLVIIGSRDPATKPADGELIVSSIRNAKTVIFDAAHISNIEQPEAFASTVIEFLA